MSRMLREEKQIPQGRIIRENEIYKKENAMGEKDQTMVESNQSRILISGRSSGYGDQKIKQRK